MLMEWTATRIFRNTRLKQGQINPNTVLSYLSTFKSYYMDKRLSLKNSNNSWIAEINNDGRQLFSSKRRNYLSITENIIEKITNEESFSISELNIDSTFKVVQASFIRIEELIYTAAEAKKAMFIDKDVIWSNILVVEGDLYAILCLKKSKINTEHTGMQIILCIMGKRIYSVAALRKLFIQDPQLANAPLFRLQSLAFSPRPSFISLNNTS